MGDLTITTDTEYDEVNLTQFPEAIRITQSGNSKVDGTYVRMYNACRGRPCYASRKKEKQVYMYWCKEKWLIGWDFGSSRSVAKVQQAGNITPCEPYPHTWKVQEKKEKEKEGEEKKDKKKLEF